MVPVGDKSSTGSSSAAYNAAGADNPKERLKECCRKLVAFMCTQVGVGGLVVGYAVVGAFCFIQIEGQAGDAQHHAVEQLRHNCSVNVWNATNTYNVLYRDNWTRQVTDALTHFQVNLALIVKKGYDGRTTEETWSFSAALMFSLSIFTMNGYGNVVPKTMLGKAATVVYAVFGIPLYVLYFRNMGKVLAQSFRWLYTWVYQCSMEDKAGNDPYNQQLPQKSRVIVPSMACLWVLAAYVATGTVTFVTLEDWSYLDSTFFCVTSLCKIGIENFVPVGSITDAATDHPMKLVIKFVYLLLGMGIIAMCFDLMREDVQVRVRNLKMDIGLCFEDIRLRAVAVYRRRNSFD